VGHFVDIKRFTGSILVTPTICQVCVINQIRCFTGWLRFLCFGNLVKNFIKTCFMKGQPI